MQYSCPSLLSCFRAPLWLPGALEVNLRFTNSALRDLLGLGSTSQHSVISTQTTSCVPGQAQWCSAHCVQWMHQDHSQVFFYLFCEGFFVTLAGLELVQQVGLQSERFTCLCLQVLRLNVWITIPGSPMCVDRICTGWVCLSTGQVRVIRRKSLSWGDASVRSSCKAIN